MDVVSGVGDDLMGSRSAEPHEFLAEFESHRPNALVEFFRCEGWHLAGGQDH